MLIPYPLCAVHTKSRLATIRTNIAIPLETFHTHSASRNGNLQDLMAELDSELSGDFRNMLLDLMRLPWERELQALISSVKGAGTDESLLVHVLLTHGALVSCSSMTFFTYVCICGAQHSSVFVLFLFF